MGRTSLLMVVGFSTIFALMGFNLSHVAGEGVKNFTIYNTATQAHNIASSAANVACNQIFFTPNWRDGYNNVSFAGGKYFVQVRDLPNRRIQVTARADYSGPNDRTGEYEDKQSIITVVMQPSSFSKFAYYSEVEGSIYWITGDTVWGPFHTQEKLSVSGNPVFYGKVTARKGLSKKTKTSKPEFYGGFASGVSVSLPATMTPMTDAAKDDGHYTDGIDVYLTFNADGTVTYQEGSDPAQTVSLESYAPNGVICVDNGNLHIQGTVSGNVTVSALGSSGLGKGNVYLDDDIVYSTDPNDPNCTDMLGIVSDNNVVITNNAANNDDININASIFCRKGGFGAEDYNTRPIAGSINLVGGIQQYQRAAVGTFGSSGTINHGFQKNYRYDNRLMTDLPPFYPTTGSYEIVSWYE